jgi:hypothetical protein
MKQPIHKILAIVLCLSTLCATQSTLNLQDLVNEAKAKNQKELVLPSGTFKVGSVSIYGASGLRINL